MNKHTMSNYASKDEMLAAVMAENRALHEQLEAIGAGGVEPLRKCAGLMQIQEPARLAAVQQGVQPESIGKTCMDGGTCHHDCKERCFRRECCAPLTVALNAGLTIEQWRYPVTHPSQQGLDAQKEARNTGINHGVCLALQIMTAAGDAGSAQWDELVDTAGRAELEHYAKFVEPEEWELGGFAQVERAKQEDADTDAALAAQAKQGGE